MSRIARANNTFPDRTILRVCRLVLLGTLHCIKYPVLSHVFSHVFHCVAQALTKWIGWQSFPPKLPKLLQELLFCFFVYFGVSCKMTENYIGANLKLVSGRTQQEHTTNTRNPVSVKPRRVWKRNFPSFEIY